MRCTIEFLSSLKVTLSPVGLASPMQCYEVGALPQWLREGKAGRLSSKGIPSGEILV